VGWEGWGEGELVQQEAARKVPAAAAARLMIFTIFMVVSLRLFARPGGIAEPPQA